MGVGWLGEGEGITVDGLAGSSKAAGPNDGNVKGAHGEEDAVALRGFCIDEAVVDEDLEDAGVP